MNPFNVQDIVIASLAGAVADKELPGQAFRVLAAALALASREPVMEAGKVVIKLTTASVPGVRRRKVGYYRKILVMRGYLERAHATTKSGKRRALRDYYIVKLPPDLEPQKSRARRRTR